jgi:hypothetical protein
MDAKDLRSDPKYPNGLKGVAAWILERIKCVVPNTNLVFCSLQYNMNHVIWSLKMQIMK